MTFYIYGALFMFGIVIAEDNNQEWWKEVFLAITWPITLGGYVFELLNNFKGEKK